MDREHPAATRDEAFGPVLPRTRLFTLRVWKADVPGGTEYRGHVRDVTSGAWRNFRDWSDAQSFVIAQVDEQEQSRLPPTEGDA